MHGDLRELMIIISVPIKGCSSDCAMDHDAGRDGQKNISYRHVSQKSEYNASGVINMYSDDNKYGQKAYQIMYLVIPKTGMMARWNMQWTDDSVEGAQGKCTENR